MSTFSKQLIIPETLNIESKTKTDNYAKFTAEPYEKGYGHTIGNSLRRILLSSLDGAAVVAVRIKGARHEYAAVNGVQEDPLPPASPQRTRRDEAPSPACPAPAP